jgi:hypothetical protein
MRHIFETRVGFRLAARRLSAGGPAAVGWRPGGCRLAARRLSAGRPDGYPTGF